MKDYTVTYQLPRYEQGKWVGTDTRKATITERDEFHATKRFVEMLATKGPTLAESVHVVSVKRSK